MFRIESYITPIIINYVEKYVKNFRPQDAQVSIFSGDVAFQNLDLRLNALEEDLDLPLKFISGHVHELSIHIPWVKLASEPIVVAINTIEFVFQLRDANDLPTKTSTKEQISPVQEPPPGYLASLVAKIVNNISIKCNNIILKYVEEEIVLSCNIQELTWSSADMNWRPAFIDVSPIKFLVRKLVKVNDLTVCLDKRNAMGKIEVCLEPILYRCSLEGRIVKKYNFSTREKTSLNRIDILIKFLDINVSTDQFPMLRRLVELMSVLPEKKSDLDLAIQRASTENQEQEQSEEEEAEGFVSWLWNQVPAIFPPEEDESGQESSNDDDEEHIIHFGTYIDTIKVMFKSQEIFNESSMGSIKKVKFTPLMHLEFNGTFLESIQIGKTWQNTQAGISSMKCGFLGDCPCKSPTTVKEPFYSSSTYEPEKYLIGSLFDPESPENLGMQCKYTANWTSHMEYETESKLLERTGAIAIDIVNFSAEMSLNSVESNVGSGLDLTMVNKKHFIRAFIGPFTLKYCPDLLHRTKLIVSFLEAYKYSPYLEPKPSLSRSSLQPPTDDDVESFLKGIPLQIIDISIINPSLQIHFWDHTGSSKSDKRKFTKRGMEKLLLPYLQLTMDRLNAQIQYPLEPKLVPILSQLENMIPILAESPYRRTTIDLNDITGALCFARNSYNVLEIEYLSLKVRELLMPELWSKQDAIKMNVDMIIKPFIIKGNAAQFFLVHYLVESNTKMRYFDVLNTSLLADISNQYLVQLDFHLDLLIAGYDVTDNYQILQLEVDKCNGHAEIPALALRTHVVKWPRWHSRDNFISLALQLPLNETAVDHPPIINLRMEAGGICIDSLVSRFLNYDLKRWSQPMYYEPVNVSSKSDTAVVLDTPVRRKVSVEAKKPLQAIPSVHSSSDIDAGASMIVEVTEDEGTEKTDTNIFEMLKRMVLQIDVGETTVYFPTKCMTQSIFEYKLTKQGSLKDNDVTIFRLPDLTILSSVGQISINTENLPISIPKKYWSHEKLSFPWNIEFSDCSISTIQNGKHFPFLHPNTTNIIININDQGPLSVDLHIDMKPIDVNFIVDQMNFIMRNVRQFMDLALVKRLYVTPQPTKPTLDFSTNSNSQVSTEIKEFLSYAQTSWFSSFKSNDSKSDNRSDCTTAPLTTIPVQHGAYSLLVQFTLSKVSLVAFNCDPTTKCNKKFTVSLEDIIISFNQRPNYHQLTLKVASAKGECHEKMFDEYIKNENLRFHFHSDGEIVHEKGARDAAVLQLMVTCADKIDVQTKWKVKIKPNLNSESRFLTEVGLKMQHIDVVLDLDLLGQFIGAFRLDQRRSDRDLVHKSVTSVDDLPLFDFQSKGIRVFLPVTSSKKDCNVYILRIAEIKMIEPENKINRNALRPDIYHKAQQLGILDVYGTKVENRQYELIFQNISLCTGNWINVLDTLHKQQTATHHDNPALEWNQKEAPPSNKPEIIVKTVFSEFNLGIVYAPSIIFENVLVCQEAIEFNCTKDMVLSMSLNQVTLALQIGVLYEQVMTILYPKPKPDLLVINEATQEYVGVSSGLFQSSPTPVKRAGSIDIPTSPHRDSLLCNANVMRSRRMPKRTQSLIQIEKRSLQDSGIESLGASYEKKRLKHRISQLKKNHQIKEIVLMPYEIYFNGGIFTFYLYDSDDELEKIKTESSSLLTMVLDRPNIFIKQNNYEKSVKVSLHDIKITLAMEVQREAHKKRYLSVPILKTRPGESDHTGAKLPFFEFRHLSSLTKTDEILMKIGRPVKLKLSHKSLQKLLELNQTITSTLEKGYKNRSKQVIPVPAKRTNAFVQVKTFVQGLNKLDINMAQIIVELSVPKSYDFKLTCAKVSTGLSLVERIERVNFDITMHSLILTCNGETIIHPFTVESELSVSQESWKREPIIVLMIKSHFLQFDIHYRHLKEFLVMQKEVNSVLEKYEALQEAARQASSLFVLSSDESENKFEYVPLKLSSPVQKVRHRQENYEDDLRAGAFQFIETTSLAELPLPYQIQIYSKNDTSSICWRYPQPRCLSQVKLFPVPIQFTKPTVLECKLEYYNGVRENFMLVRSFVLSDQEVTNVDIPNRNICSSIWRMTVMQLVVKSDDDDDSENEDDEEDEETSDSTKDLKADCSINDILSSQSSFHTATSHQSTFSPKLFVGCLRVDSYYNPSRIQTAEVIIDFGNIQINLMACSTVGERIPQILRGLQLEGGLMPPHKCLSLSLSSLLCHASIWDNLHVTFDAETEVACDIIDYTFLNYTALLENFKIRAYIECTNDEKKVNFVTTTMHLRYGQSVAHAISVLKRCFVFDDDLPDQQDLILMSRYIVCNTTNTDLAFMQCGVSESHPLPAQSFYLYSLHLEPNHLNSQIVVGFEDEDFSSPINIDKEGTHKCIVNNHILIITIQNISSFQKKIIIAGHIQFYNMTAHPFLIHYKIFPNQVDSTQHAIVTDFIVREKRIASAAGPCIDPSVHESIRIKFQSLRSKAWSGEIPLKEIGKNNKPWMVKVPAANKFGEASFWVRILRENLEEFRVTKNYCVQRVLVVIWPLYSLKSNLTVHTTAYEDVHKHNYSIFGRGEIKEMQMPGTYEDDHELSFKMDFKSHHDEDKRKAVLSYNLIDSKQFFQVPPNIKHNIENAIKLLQTEPSPSWPCKREEELRWNRENSFQEGTLPIYKCGPTQELSCSLMLTISPWALIINSTGVSIRLKSSDGNERCLIQPNNVVMPFSVECTFDFEVKLVKEEWTYGGLLHINNNCKLGPDSFLIPDEGIVPIVVRKDNVLANFVIHSLSEDNMRVFIITTGHVVINYTEYDLSFFSFAILTNEKGSGLKIHENVKESIYTTDRTSSHAIDAKGTPVTLFSCVGSTKTKFKIDSTYNYFLSLFNTDPECYSCPLLLNRKFKRKSFSILCGDTYIPFIASIHRYQDQHFVSIYKDEAPILAVENMTDFHIFVAQADTLNTNKAASPVNDCDADERFKWYQQVPSKTLIYYTPPILDNTFPEIDPVEYGLIFACVSTSGDSLRWSRPVKIDENKEVFLEIPLYGDIKVSLNTTGKTIKVVLDYIRQDTEFSAKDIRARLSNPPSLSNISILSTNSDPKTTSKIPIQPIRDVSDHSLDTSRTFRDGLSIHTFIEGIHITLFNNSDKKSNRKREILLFNLDDVTLRICYLTRQIHLTFDNFQADNQLFTNGDFDFPVIICAQQDYSPPGKRPSVYEIEQWIKTRSDTTCFGDIRVELYENDEEGVKSVEIRIKPLRAYIEDSYIMELVDYISDCFGTNALYDVEPYFDKEKCPKDRVLVPREVQQVAYADVKTVRLKIIRVHPLNVLLSVHTCLRMYIALDHSPLDFSMYELADVNTLPENLSASASMHYLSGAIFGAGWVVGSLEILGSPSGLVRTVSSGLRDFISMPVQGLFNGPWGFLVGITQGSTSLLRNITAGTVNSVTKLAASLSRNLDRLTLDSEHVQRTDAIRRSRPQGVTAGFTQGLTGLGISILGALGGLAHHPLQANSPVQIVTGIGKGLVGAVAKPISGAAELVALTGQGVLQTVGFNNLPVPRALQEPNESPTQAFTSKFLWRPLFVQHPNDALLFACLATMRCKNGFKSVQITMLKSVMVIFDATRFTKLFTYNLNEIRLSIQKEDATLVVVTKETDNGEPEFHDEYHVSPRTIQYVSNLPHWPNNETVMEEGVTTGVQEKSEPHDEGDDQDESMNVGFYMDESHARHLVAYVELLKRFTHVSSNEFSPYE